MSFNPGNYAHRIRLALRSVLVGPQVLAFLPAITLGGYWFGGEGLMLYMALLLPVLFAISGLFSGTGSLLDARDGETGLKLRRAAETALDAYLIAEKETGRTTAAISISIDDFGKLEEQFGAKAASMTLVQVSERLQSTLRDNDIVVRLDTSKFGIALMPMRRLDLEILIQLSARIQAAIAEPYSIDATKVYLTISIGFCTTSRLPTRSGEAMIEAAESALIAAQVNGSGSIRAFSPETRRRAAEMSLIQDGVTDALEAGQIRPWFQPQVSTDTGAITGFEALARWEHPEKGTILPADFLPALASAGQMERLGEVMLYQSLSALKDWEKAGQVVEKISVNFSHTELENPKLCEKIRWELDRFGISPDRLCIEILEDVIAESHVEVITKNICALSEMGCRIDLDDFGTGHASIANIRRFSVNRIKIDRSFVTRVDRDRDQQNMVAAVLTMAERLDLETLAEGVETVGEHAMLAQLGCGHVQGFSVARPMPSGDALKWITQHKQKVPDTIQLGRKAG